jgi:4-hydroxybenzoate polyprenyltransferase
MSRRHAFAQLMRLPALPTALADVGLGAFAAGALPGHWFSWLLAALASACLYTAGMVFNDFFDVEQDRRERPSRPLPSGRVSVSEAALLGSCLMLAGLLAALLTWPVLARSPEVARPSTPALLAVLLVVAVLLYDARLKRTRVGPLGMGACRFLNVLLGFSAWGAEVNALALHLALVVGLWVVGVTWFARTEARTSKQSALAGAAALMLASLVLALPLPEYRHPGQQSSALFVYLLVGLGLAVGMPACKAIANPTPARVQAAVRRALLGIIVLDSALASALAGNVALVLLVLLVPALYLTRLRWLYAT